MMVVVAAVVVVVETESFVSHSTFYLGGGKGPPASPVVGRDPCACVLIQVTP